jgi:hypothetical protein
MASGLLACFSGPNAAFVSTSPRQQRSQAFGLAQGGMNLGQGTFMILPVPPRSTSPRR